MQPGSREIHTITCTIPNTRNGRWTCVSKTMCTIPHLGLCCYGNSNQNKLFLQSYTMVETVTYEYTTAQVSNCARQKWNPLHSSNCLVLISLFKRYDGYLATCSRDFIVLQSPHLGRQGNSQLGRQAHLDSLIGTKLATFDCTTCAIFLKSKLQLP